MTHQQVSAELNACIDACLDCFRSCQQGAVIHCLELGGKHVEPQHFRLMLDCAEICRATAALMLNGSSFYSDVCKTCAEICRACAKSCREMGGMDDCVSACERCADSCEQMATKGGGGRTTKATHTEQPAAH